jgi:hypothetical protein
MSSLKALTNPASALGNPTSLPPPTGKGMLRAKGKSKSPPKAQGEKMDCAQCQTANLRVLDSATPAPNQNS